MTHDAHITYKSLFATPGRTWFVAATAIGRMPAAMKTLGCLLLVQQLTGSYGLAGVVGAVQTLVAAFAAPQLARLIDRFGERPVLIWTMIMSVIGVAWLIITAYSPLPSWTMFGGAALLGGASVPFHSLSRARWVSALGRGRALERAYALESMIDESGFVIGPMLVVPLSVSVHPTAGLLAALVAIITGSLMLLSPRAMSSSRVSANSEPPWEEHSARPVALIPGVLLIIVSLLLMGELFGAAEIVIVAFAEHHGNESAASIIAACFAMGSLLGAIGYGAIRWNSSPRAKLLATFWWIGLGSIPMLLAPTIPWMIAAVFITGLAISPGMIVANLFVEQIVPHRKLTEAFAWLGSAMATGAAAGSIMAGIFVDHWGVRGGQVAVVAGGLACGVIITLSWRVLTVPKSDPVASV